MKTCFKCNIKKAYKEFYKHSGMADGYLNKCKSCARKDSRETRKNNLEYYKKYDAIRATNKKRKQKRKEYASTENGKKAIRQGQKRWAERNKEKRFAHGKLRRAMQKGEVKKWPCQICGEKNSHGHHEDYKKPLNVIWLCQKHHRLLHKFKNLLERN